MSDPFVQARIEKSKKTRALDAMREAITKVGQDGRKVTMVTCGPMTNLALFISVYPDLLEYVERFAFMGGAVGIGNIGAVAGEMIASYTWNSQLMWNRV